MASVFEHVFAIYDKNQYVRSVNECDSSENHKMENNKTTIIDVLMMRRNDSGVHFDDQIENGRYDVQTTKNSSMNNIMINDLTNDLANNNNMTNKHEQQAV